MKTISEQERELFRFRKYDNLGTFKINADFVRAYSIEECDRELMVSYLPMLPLLEHTVPIEEADYILYMHMYARCDDLSDFVEKQIRKIAKIRKKGAEIIVLGKAANVQEGIGKDIENITYWHSHFTEKLGKKFNIDIKDQYFVYDVKNESLNMWPVNGCLQKCKFCRRSYMYIPFESLSLETIKKQLDYIREKTPEQLNKINIRAENLTEYGIDIYGGQMLHKLIDMINEYDEIHEVSIIIGLSIGEINSEILEALCRCKKITHIAMNIETGSDRLLKFIGKKHTCEQVKYVFSEIRKSLPNAQISTTMMLGLPSENMGDILDTAKIILEAKPTNILCNFFICSPHSPLAKYPQLSQSCKEYHLRSLLKYLNEAEGRFGGEFECFITCWRIPKKRRNKKAILSKAKIIEKNRYNNKMGYLPEHEQMKVKVQC